MTTKIISPSFILTTDEIQKMQMIIDRECMGDIDTFVGIAVKTAIKHDTLNVHKKMLDLENKL